VIVAVITVFPLLVLTLKVPVAFPVASEVVDTGVTVPYIGLSVVNTTVAPCIDPSDKFETSTVMVD
jgi:hypothetical protein